MQPEVTVTEDGVNAVGIEEGVGASPPGVEDALDRLAIFRRQNARFGQICGDALTQPNAGGE